MELDVVKGFLELGTQAIFLGLFIRADNRLQERQAAYERETKDLNDKRVQDYTRWTDTLTAILMGNRYVSPREANGIMSRAPTNLGD